MKFRTIFWPVLIAGCLVGAFMVFLINKLYGNSINQVGATASTTNSIVNQVESIL